MQLQIEAPLRPLARATDPATSHAAAASAAGLARDHHAKILEAIQIFGPATIYQVAYMTNLTHVQVARRMPELQAAGDVRVKTDETRAAPTGRQCRVWELAT